MYIHIPCDFYKSNMDILFIEFTSNQNLSKEWSKNLIKSTCDTYLRVIQEEQNQKHLVIANQVRMFRSKRTLASKILKN